jgi:hypothetical protein
MHSKTERQIFRFWNGEKETAVDPLAVFRKLSSWPGLNLTSDVQAIEMLQGYFAKLEKDPKVADSEVQKQVLKAGLEAWERVLGATRHALGVEAFRLDDEGVERGMTDEETMSTFHELLGYLGTLKKNTSSKVTLQPITGPAFSNMAQNKTATN